MVCFLTSSPTVGRSGAFNAENGFVDKLRKYVLKGSRALFVCSDPDNYGFTDSFAESIRGSFKAIGIEFSDYAVLDGRNISVAPKLVKNAELIILAGGHVPTQNAFFAKVNLRELLSGYNGTVLGISAGSMNSADIVYAQPELDGESVDPNYRRFVPGLCLTKTMLLPHYQLTKDEVLDGKRLFEDITYTDSIGRKFYAIVDGSFLFIEDGSESLFGEAYLIENGEISKISSVGDAVSL